MTLFDSAVELIMGAQAEMAIFVFAIFFHALIFGQYQFRPASSKTKRAGSPGQGKKGKDATASPTPAQRAPNAQPLTRTVKSLVQQGASQEKFTSELESSLQVLGPAESNHVLVCLFEGLGKSTNCELLSAVREALDKRSVTPSMRLSELLLRGFLALHMKFEFEELLSAVEAAGSVPPPITLLAMRAAINSSDLESAIGRFRSLAATWRSASGATAPGAPQYLMTKLIQLSSDKGELPMLLHELCACGCLLPWTLAAVLAECSKRGDSVMLCEAADLALKHGVEPTATGYCAMIRGAGSAADAQRHFLKSVEAGPASKDLVLAALSSAATHESAEFAEAVLQRLPPNPAPEVAAALIGLTARGFFAAQDKDCALVELFDKHLAGVDVLADVRAARLLVSAALRRSRPDIIKQLLAACADHPRLVALVKSFGHDGCLRDAVEIFKASPEKTTCLYNALLDTCIECKDIQAAERVMSEAVASNVADVITYNTIIKAHLQDGSPQRARALMGKMRAAGLAPNCVTFNELIDAAIKTGSEQAWKLLDDMKDCGIRPNHVTCSILLKKIQPSSRTVDVERTMAVVATMEDEMDEVLLSSVCEACIRVGRPDILRQHLRRQRTSSSILVKGAHTFGSIIRGFGFLKDLEGVWNTWREMRTRHVVPTSITIGCMVEALVQNGDAEAGYELIHDMLSNPQTRSLVNAVIYCSVLKGFSHQKRFDRVWAVYEEMRTDKLQFSIVTYNALVDACARSSQMVRIPAILKEMSHKGLEPNIVTYSTILKGYCQENRLDKAFELLEDMKATTEFRPDEITYNTLLDGCARYALFDRGLALLEEMQEAGVQPTNFTLSVAVKLANRCKQPDRAFEICDELSRKYHLRPNVHVYNNLVHARTAYGELERSLEVFDTMLSEKVRPDARTYKLLIQCCVKLGLAQDAAGLLRAACGITQGAHARLAGFRDLAQPQKGVPAEIISEALEGVAVQCGEGRLAMQLLRDLRRQPGVKLDSKLPQWFASMAASQS